MVVADLDILQKVKVGKSYFSLKNLLGLEFLSRKYLISQQMNTIEPTLGIHVYLLHSMLRCFKKIRKGEFVLYMIEIL